MENEILIDIISEIVIVPKFNFTTKPLLLIVVITSMQPPPCVNSFTRGRMMIGFASSRSRILIRLTGRRCYSSSYCSYDIFYTNYCNKAQTISNCCRTYNQQQRRNLRTYPTLTRRPKFALLPGTSTTTFSLSSLSSSSSSRSIVQASSIIEEAEQEVFKVIEWLNTVEHPNSSNATIPIVLQTQNDVQEYIKQNNIDTFLFDCDGVLYRSPDAIPGARECIMSLLQNHKSIYFITNNAASNRQQLRTKLTTILNLPDPTILTDDMILSSSYSCAQYLKDYYYSTKNCSSNRIPVIYVIGSQGLCDEIESVTGYRVVRTSDDDNESYSMTREELAEYQLPNDGRIDAVVIGHDTSFHFRKLCIATVLLQQNANAILVATNMDAYDIVGSTDGGRHIPGNGALVSAIQYATKRTIINVGKPSTTLFQLLQQQYPTIIDPTKTIMIGDRIDTDIQFGRNNNMMTALVMTGVTTADTLRWIGIDGGTNNNNNDKEPQPTIILSHVGLINLME